MLKSSPHSPFIVFTTAHEDYAVEAFGLNAVDYLLKPYSQLRLKETLQRIRAKLAEPQPEPSSLSPRKGLSAPGGRLNKLLVEDGEKHVLLDPETILYAVREEKVIRIHTAEGQCITSKQTLQELEDRLEGYSFFRPYRSYLVNLKMIDELVPWFNGAYNLILKDAKRTAIPVSREAAKELFRMFKGE